MAEISDEMLTFVVNRAKTIRFGEIRLVFNENLPQKIDIEVIEKARFRVDDQVLPVQKPPRALPDGKDPPGERRRG